METKEGHFGSLTDQEAWSPCGLHGNPPGEKHPVHKWIGDDSTSLKILHIDTGRKLRGGQQQVIYLLRALLEAGYDTSLVLRRNSLLTLHAQKEGLPMTVLPLAGECDLFSAMKIAQLCRWQRFDIIHAHTSHAHGLGLLSKLMYSRIKLVVTRRVDFPILSNWGNLYKYRRADAIICLSKAIRRTLLDCGLAAENINVVYAGVDAGRMAGNPPDSGALPLDVRPTDYVVGTVASFTPEKDYETYVRTAEIVLAQRSDVVFVGLGDGPERPQMLRQARARNLEGKVHFPGFRQDVGRFLQQFDLYVAASLREGLGTSILDAMSLGIPVVASRTGGIPEIVRQGENGLLCSPGEPEKFADGILKIIGDDQLRQQMGKNARLVATQFTVERMLEGNIRVYQSLLA